MWMHGNRERVLHVTSWSNDSNDDVMRVNV